MELAAIATVLGAMGALLKVVLNHLGKQEQRFVTFLGNHLSGNTKALRDLTRAVEALADRLEAHNRDDH